MHGVSHMEFTARHALLQSMWLVRLPRAWTLKLELKNVRWKCSWEKMILHADIYAPDLMPIKFLSYDCVHAINSFVYELSLQLMKKGGMRRCGSSANMHWASCWAHWASAWWPGNQHCAAKTNLGPWKQRSFGSSSSELENKMWKKCWTWAFTCEGVFKWALRTKHPDHEELIGNLVVWVNLPNEF